MCLGPQDIPKVRGCRSNILFVLMEFNQLSAFLKNKILHIISKDGFLAPSSLENCMVWPHWNHISACWSLWLVLDRCRPFGQGLCSSALPWSHPTWLPLDITKYCHYQGQLPLETAGMSPCCEFALLSNQLWFLLSSHYFPHSFVTNQIQSKSVLDGEQAWLTFTLTGY